jgi:hypothetical protein
MGTIYSKPAQRMLILYEEYAYRDLKYESS